jgi:5-methylcytosine-specific restriction endonuclease McrA
MQVVVYNEKMLDKVCIDLYAKLKEYGELSVCYEKPFKYKTKKQTAFYFGALVKSIVEFYLEQGNEYTPDEVKTNFYQAIAPRKTITQFNGKQYETWKSISKMSLEEMSEFIDKSIWLCDNAKEFKGLILHPSIRYTFIRHLEPLDVHSINTGAFPSKCHEYLEYALKQACLVCGVCHQSEAHHLKEVNQSGVGYKVDDWEVIPLCKECHRNYHTQGKGWFNEQVKWITKYLSIEDFCAVNFNRWLMKGK